MIRRFYAEDDPFHELFQVWNAMSSFLFFMNRIDNAFLNPNSRDSDLSSFLGLPMLRIADLSDLQTKMNVTCKPTVTEGKWYRMESILAALLIRRSVECHSNDDNSDVFVEAFTPAPTVVESGEMETEGKQKQGNRLSGSVLVIALLCEEERWDCSGRSVPQQPHRGSFASCPDPIRHVLILPFGEMEAFHHLCCILICV